MRFMIILKGDADYEGGAAPSPEYFAQMHAFNQELTKAGLMLTGEGLQPSAKGARVKFAGTQRIVTDGPFVEAKELVAGFWIWQVRSLQEAIDWVKRIPMPSGDCQTEVEIRELFDIYATAGNERPQLAKFLELLAERRAMLHQQREDIDAVLAEIAFIERDCRRRLKLESGLATSAEGK